MLNGTTYKTPDFYCTSLNDKPYRFASERCALSWGQRMVESASIEKPSSVLGFRSGTLLQDFKSGTLWYIDGAVRRQVDFDAWNKHQFNWDDVVICSRKELELHVAKGDLSA